jgi:hypothetical protein
MFGSLSDDSLFLGTATGSRGVAALERVVLHAGDRCVNIRVMVRGSVLALLHKALDPKAGGFTFPTICRTFEVGDAGFEPATSAV